MGELKRMKVEALVGYRETSVIHFSKKLLLVVESGLKYRFPAV